MIKQGFNTAKNCRYPQNAFSELVGAPQYKLYLSKVFHTEMSVHNTNIFYSEDSVLMGKQGGNAVSFGHFRN